jgi:DMSO reductase family type II enzyme chaperone
MPTPSEPRSVFVNFTASESGANAVRGSMEPSEVHRLAEPRRDDTPSLQKQIDTAIARSFLHRFIATLFEYPAAVSWAWIIDAGTTKSLRLAAAAMNLPGAAEELISALRKSSFESFLDAHLSAFGHAARGPVPMNEIEYGDLKADPLFQPHRLADLAAFYRAFGLEITPDASERQDHICLQLEFMSVLTAKEAFALEHQLDDGSLAVGRAAQKTFLREHLGRWMPAFVRRIERTESEPLLQAAARFAHAFISAECERFAVKTGSEDLVLRPVDDDAEQLCASCGIRDLPPGALTSM